MSTNSFTVGMLGNGIGVTESHWQAHNFLSTFTLFATKLEKKPT